MFAAKLSKDKTTCKCFYRSRLFFFFLNKTEKINKQLNARVTADDRCDIVHELQACGIYAVTFQPRSI